MSNSQRLIYKMGEANVKKTSTKADVWNGSATKTASGLTKSDLMKNKRGKIVSKVEHEMGLKAYPKLQATICKGFCKKAVVSPAVNPVVKPSRVGKTMNTEFRFY